MDRQIWEIIQFMESVVGRDGLAGLSKKQLQRLIVDVYQKLNDLV